MCKDKKENTEVIERVKKQISELFDKNKGKKIVSG